MPGKTLVPSPFFFPFPFLSFPFFHCPAQANTQPPSAVLGPYKKKCTVEITSPHLLNVLSWDTIHLKDLVQTLRILAKDYYNQKIDQVLVVGPFSFFFFHPQLK